MYERLAAVYEFLIPDPILTPEGSVAAVAPAVDSLAPGARVLDCAAGIGLLAVGLALRGFEVVASDASIAMLQRTRDLAAAHGVEMEVAARRWQELDEEDWADSFDGVFCIGNALSHAAGQPGRRESLAAMARVLRRDGLLTIRCLNWERLAGQSSRLIVGSKVVQRGERHALVIQHWSPIQTWDDPHSVTLVVAIFDASGVVTTHGERLKVWPFTHAALHDDLKAAGLRSLSTTYQADEGGYTITAAPRRGSTRRARASRMPFEQAPRHNSGRDSSHETRT